MADLKEKSTSLLSTTTVGLNSATNTTLYTVPFGKRCILSHAIIVAAADAASSVVTIGSSGTKTDFVGAQSLDNINAQYDAGIIMPVPSATTALTKSYAAGTVIVMDVTEAGGAAGNTVYLFGTLY